MYASDVLLPAASTPRYGELPPESNPAGSTVVSVEGTSKDEVESLKKYVRISSFACFLCIYIDLYIQNYTIIRYYHNYDYRFRSLKENICL